MKKNLTELVFILDKSGSMAGMEADTVGGFNAMIKKQKEAEGEAYVSTVLFSSQSTVLHDRERVEKIDTLTENEYRVGGSTALLDAIGGAIKHISNIHKYIREEDVPEHTVFVITTDGMENASREYSSKKIKEMIKLQEEKYGWEFLFLASNIDAVETAEGIGIRADRAVNYSVERETVGMYEEVGEIIHAYRRCGQMPTGAKIEKRIRERTEERRTNK